MQFVNGSPYRVALPKRRAKQDVLDLAQAFVRYENELSADERTPHTGTIEAILAQALAAQTERQKAEAERRAASEALKRLDAAALTAVRQIRFMLAGHFAQTPEQAQAWGFTVRQTGRSAGHILMPNHRKEVRLCLKQYISREQTRRATEQFTLLALADMVALRDNIQQQRQIQSRAKQRRLQANAQLDDLCQQLSAQLRRALSYLIMVKFDGQGDRQLGLWGFQVLSRTSGGSATPESEPEAEAAMAMMLEPA
jgi:hypothetical protein